MKRRYKIEASAAWHVHVGGGDEHKLDPLSYVVKESVKDGKPYFYRIDVGEMMKNDSSFADSFIRIVERDDSIHDLRKMIYDNFNPEMKKTWFHRAEVSDGFWEKYKKNVDDLSLNNQLLVHCMPLTAGRVYIPGSSIKGAIRTAVLDRLALKNGYENTVKEVNRLPGGYGKERANIIEKHLLNYSEIQGDPFKAVKVTDAFIPADSTMITEVKNIPKNKNQCKNKYESTLQNFVEMVKPGTEFEFNISIEDKAGMKGVDIKKYYLTIEEIMAKCFTYYKSVIEYERNKYYKDNKSANKRSLEALAKISGGDDKVLPGYSLIRLGRFSHLESITYNNRGKGKLCQPPQKYGTTRNLVDSEYPCGAVIMKYNKNQQV